jgi:hypothetical protein
MDDNARQDDRAKHRGRPSNMTDLRRPRPVVCVSLCDGGTATFPGAVPMEVELP